MPGLPKPQPEPPSVSIIIPAINEAGSIESVLKSIPAVFTSEILVVDGGSNDGTPELAVQAGARVLHESRRGYGQACNTGLQEALGDIVVYMDADGADDPSHLPDLVGPIVEGQAEMVLGSRLAGCILPGAMPWHQRFGNWLASRFINVLYRLSLTDLSPFRAVDRRALLELGMVEMTYGWPTEMIVRGARAGWRILEKPVNYRPRTGGQSKISGTLRGTVLATYSILATIFRYARI
jgi:glycosyltransferase involved in cell wall biosynthesis